MADFCQGGAAGRGVALNHQLDSRLPRIKGSFAASAAPTGEIAAVAVFVGAAAAAKVSLFERAGLTVMAYPVDFQVQASRHLSVMDFVPSAQAFKATEMAWREAIGRAYYEFKSF